IDVKALPDPVQGVSEQDRVAPENEVEEKLVAIWAEVLKLETIGVESNFYQHGGDSIRAIQVAARAKKIGLNVSVGNILKYQTIRELAREISVQKPEVQSVEENGVIEDFSLSPIQTDFFNRNYNRPQHYNQSAMIAMKSFPEESMVRAIFTALARHHEMLRAVPQFKNGTWTQSIMPSSEPRVSLEVCDFRNLVESESSMLEKVREIQSGIDLQHGPLWRIGLFYLKHETKLFLAMHHLIVDAVSWSALLDDIKTLYHQAQRGATLQLSVASADFRSWVNQLKAYRDTPAFQKGKSYWDGLLKTKFPLLPKNSSGEEDLIRDERKKQFTLDQKTTAALLTKANHAFNTNVQEILLSALALAMQKSFAMSQVRIDLEGHGREDLGQTLDTSRTVGWFTSVYPVTLEIRTPDDIVNHVIETKETLRSIPNKGIDFGIYQHLCPAAFAESAGAHRKSEIIFNYTGQHQHNAAESDFRTSFEMAADNIATDNQRDHALEFSLAVAFDRLTVELAFNGKHFKDEVVQALLMYYKHALEDVIAHCVKGPGIQTPSDFTYKKLSISQVRELQKKYDVQDIYTLSPIQEGLLFHHRLDPDSLAYYVQTSYRLTGVLALDMVKKGFSILCQRHDILRTIFLFKDLEQPVQVVLKHRKVDFTYVDLQPFAPDEQRALIAEAQEKDKLQNFNLQSDALLRLTVLQCAHDQYEIIWSNHHIIIDGWSINDLITEFFGIYKNLCQTEGQPLKLGPAPQFSRYIEWLQYQDKKAALKYWEEYLTEYTRMAFVPGDQVIEGQTYDLQEKNYFLDEALTARIHQATQHHSITLSTFVQTAWGVVLAKRNRTNDVAFGMIVTGRPETVEGIESMMGVFINTVPLRVRYGDNDTTRSLLQKVHQETIDIQKYQYVSMAEMNAGTGFEQPFIDHIFQFNNFPLGNFAAGTGEKSILQSLGLTINSLTGYERTNYAFTLTIEPGKKLKLKFRFNGALYSQSYIRELSDQLGNVLADMAVCPDQALRDFSLLTPTERSEALRLSQGEKRDYDLKTSLTTLIG
ncbi:non-ribosomal peptide synthase domain TIGR01720, partial [Chryseolinea serpens]